MRKNSEILKALTLVSQLGVMVIVTIFLGLFVGKILDSVLSTSFLTIIFLVLGVIAAFRNAYILIMRHLEGEGGNEK